MKWIRLFLIITILLINIVPVYAGTIVTVDYAPEITTGITNFVITYVNDTRMDLSWNLDSSLSNIMIRAKYGDYPNDIISANTTPSDGYLVYYGSGNNTSDTTMNFDQNPGLLYYKAWGQKLDGTWQTDTSTGNKESKEVILLSFIVLIGILLAVNIGTRNSFIPIKLMAAFAWAIPLIWVINYPPSFITAGSSIATVMILIIIGMLFICLFNAFRQPLQMNSSQTVGGVTTGRSSEKGGWTIAGLFQNKDSYEAKKSRRIETLNEYRQRAHDAVFPRRRDRR